MALCPTDVDDDEFDDEDDEDNNSDPIDDLRQIQNFAGANAEIVAGIFHVFTFIFVVVC